ncbi:MAG: histidinol-phosphate transaminase [Deltaproteobacteria bacterium]|nr:histidinol-phosphate transaminase [Deltaproteobacteria bacterium]
MKIRQRAISLDLNSFFSAFFDKEVQKYMEYIRPCIASMKGYVPGLQPDPNQKYIKLNSNENPFPPSPRVKEVLRELKYEDLRIYPDPISLELREKLGSLYGFSPNQIICGNGSDDILNIIIRTFAQPGEAVGFFEPTFPLYRVLGVIHGVRIISLPVDEPYDQPPLPPDDVKIFFLANPNSPVGFAYSTSRIAEMAREIKAVFVVDEAYAEFARENALALVRQLANVIIVRTVSKSYSLAGLRLGYAIGNEKLIAEMLKVKDPFNVTLLTQSLVAAALEDQEYLRNNVSRIIDTREWFSKEAAALGYRIIPSEANFVFPQPPQKGRGIGFYKTLFNRKILTRHYDEEGLRDGVRMTIGTRQEMATVLKVMKEILPQFSNK